MARPARAGKNTNAKRRGELSELAFVYKAASLGFAVAKPYGDSERYDFILISKDAAYGEKLWRVQVKSTTSRQNGLYRVNTHRSAKGCATAYRSGEVDFLVAHIIPDDAWFVVPVKEILARTSLRFSAKGNPKSGINDRYREAWDLMRGKP